MRIMIVMMMMTSLTGVITWCSSLHPSMPWAQTLIEVPDFSHTKARIMLTAKFFA